MGLIKSTAGERCRVMGDLVDKLCLSVISFFMCSCFMLGVIYICKSNLKGWTFVGSALRAPPLIGALFFKRVYYYLL